MHKGGRRVATRVSGVQAFLVGQDDEGICFDQVGHQSAQGVVVTKLDFIVDHGVVFVDDGQHAVREQSQQGGSGIEVTLAVGEVGVREQHLGRAQTVFAQLGFVHLSQTHLPYGSGGLQLVQLLWAGGPAQPLHTFGNRTTGHHDDFAAIAHQGTELATPFANGLFV